MILFLKACLDDYIVEVLKPARGDMRRAGFASGRLVEFFGAKCDAGALTRKGSRDYRAHRLAQGVTDSTIRRELGVLSAALRHAAEEERIPHVPVIKLPPEGPPRERWLSEEEVTKLMEQPMSDVARLYIYLAVGTGARKAAIETLPVKRVDLVHGYIDYRDPSLPITNKRRVKTKVSAWLLPILKTACAGKRPDDLVIGKCRTVYPEVKRLFRSIGIDERGVACHVFRRTFVMWAFLNGAKPAEVSAATGDKIATLEKSYVTLFPENSKGAVEAIHDPSRGNINA